MCRSYHRDSTDTQYAIIHKSLKSSSYTLNLYNNVPFIFWVFMTNGLIVAIIPTSCCPYQEKVASSFSIALCRVFGHENSQRWMVCTYRELYFVCLAISCLVLSQCFFVHKNCLAYNILHIFLSCTRVQWVLSSAICTCIHTWYVGVFKKEWWSSIKNASCAPIAQDLVFI